MKKMRFVCAGGWHTHAKDFPMDRAPKYASHLDYEFVAVWDNDTERGKQWAADMNCAFVADYDALLALPDVDGVLITCETAKHEELIIKAANAGIHVFVEKALTTSNESAYRIRDAVKKSGIHFTVSDPVRHGDLLYAKKLVDAGTIGTVTSARSRMANGCALAGQELIKRYYEVEDTGGGAMIDMGYHNVHRLQWFLGKPVRGTGILVPFTDYGRQKRIDENSVAVFAFEGGKVGVAETGWLTEDATSFEVYGTNGVIRSDDAGLRYRVGSGEWISIPKEEIPPQDTYPLCYWMESIAYNTPCEKYDIDQAVVYTEMLMAAIQGDKASVKVEDR